LSAPSHTSFVREQITLARNAHCDVVAKYSDGHDTMITHDGNALDAKITGGGTIGWTTGKPHEVPRNFAEASARAQKNQWRNELRSGQELRK
jgi:hypothetical protein